jgi:hypothetical protein
VIELCTEGEPLLDVFTVLDACDAWSVQEVVRHLCDVNALGLEHRTDVDGTRLAASYALFISGAVAKLYGRPVTASFQLSGLGHGSYALGHAAGVVRLHAEAEDVDGVDAATLADSLAGRGVAVADLLPESLSALSALANFFTSPV